MRYFIKKIIFTIFIVTLLYSYQNNKVATLYYGNGECFSKNKDDVFTLVTGNRIDNNDILISNADSDCQILFDDETTKVDLYQNTSIQVIDTKYSREIVLLYGSIIISNSKNSLKTYVTSNENQFYLNNNKALISIEPETGLNLIYGENGKIDVFNSKISKRIQISPYGYFSLDNNAILTLLDVENIPKMFRKHLKAEYFFIDDDIYLNDYDLIPVYGKIKEQKESKFSIHYETGSRIMNKNNYMKFAAYPFYKYNDFFIGANLEVFVNADGELYKNWDEAIDLVEKLQFSYVNDKFIINGGQIDPITFGHGYLVRNFGNSFNYPHQSNMGINFYYKIDDDFMDLNFFIPSLRDFVNGGGVLGFHTSLFISHKFPLKLGLGLVTDINQVSSSENIYSFIDQSIDGIEYGVSAMEIDYEYKLFSSMNLNIDVYGELVGIWYPQDIYYMKIDGSPYTDDLRWRKGTWGILGPGLKFNINNRLELKLSPNLNSACHLPSMFNSNYLMNRSIYYNANDVNLDFPLIVEQINMINNFMIEQDEYIIPKTIYPILNNTFNPFQVFGFTGELAYNYKDKVSFSSMGSVYFQKTENITAGHFYSIEASAKIKEGVIRNISFIEMYLSNIFFWSADDKQQINLGCKVGVDLPSRLSLIFDMNQVYYDYNLNGGLNESLNIGLGLKMKF